MNYYANTNTFEYKQCGSIEECGEGSWVQMPPKPMTACSVGSDFTWQPPLPKLDDFYNWETETNSWVKR